MKCPICQQRKGKRRCQINANQFICSQCCGVVRHDGCDGCAYHESSLQHQRTQRIADKKFVTELLPDVEEQCEKALALLDQGKIAEGQKILERLREDHPDYHVVLYGMGVCYGLQQQADLAIECFHRAIDRFPPFTQAYFNLGTSYCQALDIPGAARAFEAVIELDGRDGSCGRLAAKRLEDFETTIQTNNGISLATYLRNHEVFDRAFAALKKGEYTKAIKLFERVLSVDSKSVQSHGNLGLAYAGAGDKQKAIEYLDKAITLDSEYEPAIMNRRLVEKKMQDGQSYMPGIHEVQYYRDRRMARGQVATKHGPGA